MAEIAEDQLDAAPSGEVKPEELDVGTPRKPDETEAEYLARAGAKPEEKGLLEKAAEYLKPETATGAFAAGVSKGAPLGFGDELYGVVNADSDANEQRQKIIDDVDAQKRKDADALVEAARYGTDALKTEHDRQGAAKAPAIPGVASVGFKAPGQEKVVPISVSAAKKPDTEEAAPQPDVRQAYRNARDSMRDLYRRAEDPKTGHPNLFLGGEVLGGLAVPLPGVGKAKGWAKAGKYALTGAGVGGINALGNSEADLTHADPGEFGRAVGDTVKGGVLGGAIGGALGGVAAKLDPFLERAASRRAYKAMDPYMKTIADGLGPDVASGKVPASEAFKEMERLGRRTLDEGVIPEGRLGRFSSTETMNGRAHELLNEAGALKGGFVDHAADELAKKGQPTPVSLGRLATQLEQEAAAAKVSGNQKLARRLLSEAREVRQTVVDRAEAGMTDPAAQGLQEAERFKTMKQGEVDYGRPLASREAQTATARLAKEQAEKAIEGGLGPEDLEQFKALKNRYGDLATIAQTTGHGAIRSFRNQSAGLGDKIAAEVGAHAATGPLAIPAALATGAANHVANNRGSAGLARTLDNAAKRVSPALTPSIQQAQDKAKSLTDDEADQQEPWQTLKGGR